MIPGLFGGSAQGAGLPSIQRKEGAVVMPFTRVYARRLAGAVLVCGGVLALVIAPASATGAKGKACRPPTKAWHFFSAPRLSPPRVHVCTRKKGVAKGMVFLGPFKSGTRKFVGQAGALMVNQGGNPVWFHRAPKNEQDTNFGTQSYRGQTVIAFWQGVIATPPKYPYSEFPAGAPVRGEFLLYNTKYRQVKTIKAQGKGWVTDFHDLVITKPTAKDSQGTAIFFAAKKKHKNLGPYGGSVNGAYEDQEIQQVNLANNHLIFHWDVDQHIKLKDSKILPGKGAVWDPYHANSLNLNKSGDVLVSLRDTWGVYEVSPAGKIVWQVGGKCAVKKCLQPTKAAKFGWQHDARYDGNKKISMFDDGCCLIGVYRNSGTGFLHPARGLVLSLNFSKKRAGLVRQYHHADTRHILTGGSFRFLSDGHAFIGWGQSPFYSEQTAKGMLYDAAMPEGDQSYRAVKAPWSATPSYKPSAAARSAKHKITVYASWNGATTVARWKVLAGKSAKTVKTAAGRAKSSGFETAIHVSAKGPFFAVEAIDSHGKPIPGGTSKPVKVR